MDMMMMMMISKQFEKKNEKERFFEKQKPKFENSRLSSIESVHERSWQIPSPGCTETKLKQNLEKVKIPGPISGVSKH